MKNPWEERLHYALPALIVMAVFYGIYFGKMLVQKRHGIRTHQIGCRKEKGLHTVETFMGIATLGVPIAQLMSIAFEWNHLPSGARFSGFLVGLLGDGIFLLSVLCMKDSWRAGIPYKDKTELVTTGIYRFSRNPAFLGFDLMYIGVLLLYGSPHNEGGNSKYLLNALKEKLNGNGKIYNIMHSSEISEKAFLQALKNGENIVFSFPLYADSLPAYFLAFLKKLKANAENINSQSRVYVIISREFTELTG